VSKLAQLNGDDHPEAAEKHLVDAKALLAAGRYDGAAYLSGYVIECALKTLLQVEGQPMWGHKLDLLSKEAMKLLAQPGARSGKYVTATTFQLSIADRASGWIETLRYRPSGHVPPPASQHWHDEATQVYKTVIAQMRLDGVI
jgi:hypothetical protein